MNTKKIIKTIKILLPWLATFSALLAATQLGGCGTAPYQNDALHRTPPPRTTIAHQNHPDYQIKNIPLSNSWQNFRCREGQFAARYGDSGRKTVQVRYLGQEQTLQHRPSNDPVIYENGQLAIFADETQIILARPMSDRIFLSGCQR